MHNTKKKDKTQFLNIILLLISFSMMLYFCIQNNNLVTLINSIPMLNIAWLILAGLSMGAFWLIDAKILNILTSSIYKKNYRFRSSLKVTMVGQYFSAITPFAVAGQPMQIVTMIRQGVSSGFAFSILVQKFLVYQTSLTIYSLSVILIKYSYFRVQFPGFMSLALIGFLVQSSIVILLLLFSINRKFTTGVIRWVFKLLSKINIIKNPEKTSDMMETQLKFYLDNNKSMNTNYRLTIKLYLSAFMQITALFIIPFFLYKAFHNEGFPVFDMISAQAFVTMISAYTPLPGGAGTSEGSFLTLFDMFFSGDVTSQAMLLWRFITYYSCIIVGTVFGGFTAKKESMKIDVNSLMNQSQNTKA